MLRRTLVLVDSIAATHVVASFIRRCRLLKNTGVYKLKIPDELRRVKSEALVALNIVALPLIKLSLTNDD